MQFQVEHDVEYEDGVPPTNMVEIPDQVSFSDLSPPVTVEAVPSMRETPLAVFYLYREAA